MVASVFNINIPTAEEETVCIEVITEEETTEEKTTEKVEETTTKAPEKKPVKTEEATTSKSKEEQTTSKPVSKPVIEETTTSNPQPKPQPKPIGKSHKITLNAILQLPELPTGCELTSLTMVLNHLGVKADKLDLADNWLLKGEVGKVHPNEYFLGNPRDNKSFGCYAPVIVNCANTYLEAKGSSLKAYNLTGAKFEDLFKEIDNGNPIVIWATVDMKQPRLSRTWKLNGKNFTWKSNEHCLVLIGYDETANKVYVADPLKGNVSYNLDTFKDRYEQLYSQAVVIK